MANLKPASELRDYNYYANMLYDPNVRAALDTIEYAEGVSKDQLAKRGMNDPYKAGVYYNEIPSLEDHPRTVFGKNTRNPSSAAGRYQALSKTWDEVSKAVGIPDFSRMSQDVFAVARIDQRGGLEPLLNGDFPAFAKAVRKEWASFPNAGYIGQHTRPYKEIKNVFDAAKQKWQSEPLPGRLSDEYVKDLGTTTGKIPVPTPAPRIELPQTGPIPTPAPRTTPINAVRPSVVPDFMSKIAPRPESMGSMPQARPQQYQSMSFGGEPMPMANSGPLSRFSNAPNPIDILKGGTGSTYDTVGLGQFEPSPPPAPVNLFSAPKPAQGVSTWQSMTQAPVVEAPRAPIEQPHVQSVMAGVETPPEFTGYKSVYNKPAGLQAQEIYQPETMPSAISFPADVYAGKTGQPLSAPKSTGFMSPRAAGLEDPIDVPSLQPLQTRSIAPRPVATVAPVQPQIRNAPTPLGPGNPNFNPSPQMQSGVAPPPETIRAPQSRYNMEGVMPIGAINAELNKYGVPGETNAPPRAGFASNLANSILNSMPKPAGIAMDVAERARYEKEKPPGAYLSPGLEGRVGRAGAVIGGGMLGGPIGALIGLGVSAAATPGTRTNSVVRSIFGGNTQSAQSSQSTPQSASYSPPSKSSSPVGAVTGVQQKAGVGIDGGQLNRVNNDYGASTLLSADGSKTYGGPGGDAGK